MTYLKLAIAFLFIGYGANAATYTTTAVAGTWDLGAEPGTTPSASDDIVINHDWSGYDWAATNARANYAGSMTVNSGGYIKLNNSATNFTGSIDVKSGGTLVVNGAYSFDGGTINVDGYFEVTSNNLAITNVALTITGAGSVSYGTTSGPGSIAGTITLPVELIKFTGNSNDLGSLIEWSTASEINNDYFEVFKSNNGLRFDLVGTVSGAGNSFERQDYSFIDFGSKASFYRLKQVDFDGSYEYSHIIKIGSEEEEQIKIISGANKGEFSVVNIPKGSGDIRVLKIDGSLLFKKAIQTEPGSISNFTINNSGVFIVSVTVNNTVVSQKVVN